MHRVRGRPGSEGRRTVQGRFFFRQATALVPPLLTSPVSRIAGSGQSLKPRPWQDDACGARIDI